MQSYALIRQKPSPAEGWSASLATYIRNNDQVLLQQADKLLSTFENEYLPVQSFAEFCDVAGKHACNQLPTSVLCDASAQQVPCFTKSLWLICD